MGKVQELTSLIPGRNSQYYNHLDITHHNSLVYLIVDCADCCPPNWRRFDKHCYLIVDTSINTWTAAQADCVAKVVALDDKYERAGTGFLASVLSQDEQDFLNGGR